MNLSSLVVDRVLRIVMFDKASGKVNWMVSQIESPTINATLETDDIVDAMGIAVAKLDRAKSMTFSASNSFFDLGLIAAQWGTEREYSDTAKIFRVPCFEEVAIASSASSATLAHTPVGVGAAGIPAIYQLDGAGNAVGRFDYAASASAKEFTFSGSTLTPPTGATGSFLVVYDYEADQDEKALQIVNSAVNFPKAGLARAEVLFRDICDPERKFYGFLEMPNCKLDGNFDLNLARDGKHPLNLMAMQEYCDREKLLCRIIVPEAA